MPTQKSFSKKSDKKQKDVVDYLLEQAGDDTIYKVEPKASREEEILSREPEGQLAVDIFDQDDTLVVIATVAGADPDHLDVHVHDDVLTIRGKREMPLSEDSRGYVHQECFWGKFSRTIILPFDVRAEGVKAVYQNGVLVVSLPKEKRESKVPITVVES